MSLKCIDFHFSQLVLKDAFCLVMYDTVVCLLMVNPISRIFEQKNYGNFPTKLEIIMVDRTFAMFT